ncbi:hypothetical protein TgHK011_009126 [Trichoderma gracile]|nr:hypothetical protein TgHK011_009126 [Trichoderma gracile]
MAGGDTTSWVVDQSRAEPRSVFWGSSFPSQLVMTFLWDLAAAPCCLSQNPWQICAFKLPLSAAPGLLVLARVLDLNISMDLAGIDASCMAKCWGLEWLPVSSPPQLSGCWDAPKVMILFGREDQDVGCVSLDATCAKSSTAPAQHLNGSRPALPWPDKTSPHPSNKVAGSRSVLCCDASLRESRCCRGWTEEQAQPGCAFDRPGDIDAAGPIAAACASVERLFSC